jgi:hypothetical protein
MPEFKEIRWCNHAGVVPVEFFHQPVIKFCALEGYIVVQNGEILILCRSCYYAGLAIPAIATSHN